MPDIVLRRLYRRRPCCPAYLLFSFSSADLITTHLFCCPNSLASVLHLCYCCINPRIWCRTYPPSLSSRVSYSSFIVSLLISPAVLIRRCLNQPAYLPPPSSFSTYLPHLFYLWIHFPASLPLSNSLPAPPLHLDLPFLLNCATEDLGHCIPTGRLFVFQGGGGVNALLVRQQTSIVSAADVLILGAQYTCNHISSGSRPPLFYSWGHGVFPESDMLPYLYSLAAVVTPGQQPQNDQLGLSTIKCGVPPCGRISWRVFTLLFLYPGMSLQRPISNADGPLPHSSVPLTSFMFISTP